MYNHRHLLVPNNQFPGQPGNPVGFAAAPGFPGTLTPASIGNGTGGTLQLVSGTPGNPTIVAFKDFTPISGISCNSITDSGRPSNVGTPGGPVHDITFIGCRFTANNSGIGVTTFGRDCCVDCVGAGSSNIQFIYCTMSPMDSSPAQITPIKAWPSSSVGTGATFVTTGTGGAPPQPGNTYQMTWGESFEFGVAVQVPTGGFVNFDHCDIWGWADGFGLTGVNWTTSNQYPSMGQTNITDCWIHDCRTDNNNVDHSNGIIPSGFSPDPAGPGMQNVLFRHNTVSGLGNTNTIGFQHLMTAGTFYDAANSYVVGQIVGATDGFAYKCATNNGPGSPQSPIANPTFWTQDGVNSYRNIQVINNHLSGMAIGVDMGVGLGGSTGMIFTDNIISNYVMWLNRIVTVSNSFNGPNGNNVGATFNGTNGNLWKRNTYQMYPGTGTGGSYDTGNPATNNGLFVLPAETVLGGGNFISATDWHN